jgi:hypothetical protein
VPEYTVYVYSIIATQKRHGKGKNFKNITYFNLSLKKIKRFIAVLVYDAGEI